MKYLQTEDMILSICTRPLSSPRGEVCRRNIAFFVGSVECSQENSHFMSHKSFFMSLFDRKGKYV